MSAIRAREDEEHFDIPLEGPPALALTAFNTARRELVRLGRAGSVSLRCDESPGKEAEWTVWIGPLRVGPVFRRERARPRRRAV